MHQNIESIHIHILPTISRSLGSSYLFILLGGIKTPDWVSHLLIAYFVASLFQIRDKRPVFVGALLPDIFKTFIPIMLLLHIEDVDITNFFAPYHTFYGVLLTGLFAATFFKDIRRAYPQILLGSFSHLTADVFLYPWGNNIWFFWPLWRGDLGTGTLWPDSLAPLAIAVFLSVIAYSYERYRAH